MAATVLALASFAPDAECLSSDKNYDAKLRSVVSEWEELPKPERLAVCADPLAVLQKLDPAIHSIGYAAILDLSLNPDMSPSVDRATFLDALVHFLLKFDAIQIRYVGPQLLSILECVATSLLFSPLVTVELLATAILKIDPTASTLTSTHLSMLKLAYATGFIEPALSIIDHDVTSFPDMTGTSDIGPLCNARLSPAAYISSSSGLTDSLTSSSVLEYHFLCGLSYMSKHRWGDAQKAFARAIAHPVKEKMVSKIMVDAYKRWILVALLSEGKLPTLPAHTMVHAKSMYNNLAGPYITIAGLFDTTDAAQLNKEIIERADMWEEDGTASLIAEVVRAYQKWQIINLRRVYRQISISQIRQLTQSADMNPRYTSDEEMLQLIRSMIESSMLLGEISGGEDETEVYLTFTGDTTVATEQEFAQELARCQRSIQGLNSQYRAANERLSGSKEYVKHLIREAKRQEKESVDPGLGFDDDVEEEDLMTGILTND